MTYRHSLTALAAVLFAAAAARADVFTFSVGASIDVGGTPNSFTSAAQSPVSNVLGYSLNANWTPGAGSPETPQSIHITVAVTAPGLTPTGDYYTAGGAPNASPFAFPGTVNSATPFGLLNPGPLPGHDAGQYTIGFVSSDPNSIGNLANASITIYSNPATYADTLGPTTFDRPGIAGFDPSGAENVAYAAKRVTVDADGRYMLAAGFDGFDGALYVYEGHFNPSNPAANLVASGIYSSEAAAALSLDLLEGANYVLVAAGESEGIEGGVILYGAGPGLATFSPVPERGPTLLAAAAVVGAGAWVRRRRVADAVSRRV